MKGELENYGESVSLIELIKNHWNSQLIKKMWKHSSSCFLPPPSPPVCEACELLITDWELKFANRLDTI